MKIKKRLLICSTACLLSLSLLLSPLQPLSSRAYALSIEEEQALGQEFLKMVRQRYTLLDDDYTNNIINQLGGYLASPLDTKPFPFHFYIIEDNTLNAFAAPGGHIFVFSGLIEVMDSMDELATVICHEIGHVSARHLSHRMEQGKKISLATMAGILAGVLLGVGPIGEALMTGSMAAGIQAQLHYSREDERQADQLGFEEMKATGFDPEGMVTTLKKIEKGHWFGTDKIPPYLLTHPTGPERMANLDAMLSHYKPKAPNEKTEMFRQIFPFLKTYVRAKCMDPQEAERRFNSDLRKDPESPLAHLGLGLIYKEKGDYDEAIEHLDKALKGGIGLIPILTNLGEAYQYKGQDKTAITILEKALKLKEDDPSALFLLAVSYENLEQYQRSIDLLERLASFQPVKKEVYYHLGICYGRQNRLALAHYHFGLYFKKTGEVEKARFHFKKAEELAEGNPELKKKIEEASKPPKEFH